MRVGIALVWIAAPLCAGRPVSVEQAVRRFEEAVAQVPGPLGPQFRELAADALQARQTGSAQRLRPANPQKGPPGRREETAPSLAALAIYQKFEQFGHPMSVAERAKFFIGLAAEVRGLPSGPTKLQLAQELRGSVTEGDLGQEALAAVGVTLGDAIEGAESDAGDYLELATLVRYEHVRPPIRGPALDAALALLELRESLCQEAGFSLTALDGKEYSLAALKGKVVLLNFWATSCMPCRKEMPDIEEIYREFRGKGLLVLAVSMEERAVVTSFLANKDYTFPVLLDPGGKVHAAFFVEGVPQTFLFDREGDLVAHAIDMRTESQLRPMLREAGLE